MISAILLAGGTGSRMGSTTPKQFLTLKAMPVALYSFHVLCLSGAIDEVIVVCDDKYRNVFKHGKASFARPGKRRQDSVLSGLQAASINADYICVHDAARPFITSELVNEVVEAAQEVGAAAAGVPLKSTIKEIDESGFVIKTPDRSRFFEIQTPQVIRKDLFIKGFEMADRLGLTATDDVSLVELLMEPVKIVTGSYKNIKITTQEDLSIAETFVFA